MSGDNGRKNKNKNKNWNSTKQEEHTVKPIQDNDIKIELIKRRYRLDDNYGLHVI